jgi:hypothetical protein
MDRGMSKIHFETKFKMPDIPYEVKCEQRDTSYKLAAIPVGEDYITYIQDHVSELRKLCMDHLQLEILRNSDTITLEHLSCTILDILYERGALHE